MWPKTTTPRLSPAGTSGRDRVTSINSSVACTPTAHASSWSMKLARAASGSPAISPSNRDREGPYGHPPPTPPDRRVTYRAVRQMASRSDTHLDRSVFSHGVSGQFTPGASTTRSHASPGAISPLPCRRDSSRPFRPAARRSVPTMPAADSCLLVSDDLASRSPPGQQVGLPRSAVIPVGPRHRMYHVRLIVDEGLRGGVPTRPERTIPPIRFVSLAPHLRATLPSDPTSR
jgi:hypothetical protein